LDGGFHGLKNSLAQIAGASPDIQKANQLHQIRIKGEPARIGSEVEVFGSSQVAQILGQLARNLI